MTSREISFSGLPHGEDQQTDAALSAAGVSTVSPGGNQVPAAVPAPAPTPPQPTGDPLLAIPPGLVAAPRPSDVRQQVMQTARNPMLRMAAARIEARKNDSP